MLEIVEVLDDRTDYQTKLIDIVDFQKSVVKYTHALTCDQKSEWSEADSKPKTDNGTLSKTNIANIASQSSVPQHVLIAYGKNSIHSIVYRASKYLTPHLRSTIQKSIASDNRSIIVQLTRIRHENSTR